MLSHSLPCKSRQKSPHKVPSCLPSNPLSSFTSATHPTKHCCLAEPAEEAGCDCWWDANVLVIPISRCLTPLADSPPLSSRRNPRLRSLEGRDCVCTCWRPHHQAGVLIEDFRQMWWIIMSNYPKLISLSRTLMYELFTEQAFPTLFLPM